MTDLFIYLFNKAFFYLRHEGDVPNVKVWRAVWMCGFILAARMIDVCYSIMRKDTAERILQ